MRLFEGTPFDRPPRCEKCDQLEEECVCSPEEMPLTPVDQQVASIFLEKRKRGKIVTLIRDLLDERDVLPELLTRLKSQCGAGGALKNGTLEIQGDHIAKVREELQSIGYRVKG